MPTTCAICCAYYMHCMLCLLHALYIMLSLFILYALGLPIESNSLNYTDNQLFLKLYSFKWYHLFLIYDEFTKASPFFQFLIVFKYLIVFVNIWMGFSLWRMKRMNVQLNFAQSSHLLSFQCIIASIEIDIFT